MQLQQFRLATVNVRVYMSPHAAARITAEKSTMQMNLPVLIVNVSWRLQSLMTPRFSFSV